MANRKAAKQKNQAAVSFYMKYPLLCLTALCLLVYGRSLKADFTDLDDRKFVEDNYEYNSDLSNIATSFTRGVFTKDQDVYYRPVLLIDFILESQLFGKNISGYHFTNLLFHILCVVLLFKFFQLLKTPNSLSFMLSAIFAVHPVLVQAVAWVPGRNDMLLFIFLLSSFILFVRYAEGLKIGYLLGGTALFLTALFTKETALLFPLLLLPYMFFFATTETKGKSVAIVAVLMLVCGAVYFMVKSQATLLPNPLNEKTILPLVAYRLPLIPQYIGKIFFPVNLSVYPLMEDTSNIWGVAGMLALIALVIFTKSYKNPKAVWGLCWFIIFLIPLILIPKQANNQLYEHRLYVPLIGLLVFGAALWPSANFRYSSYVSYAVVALLLVFSAITFVRIGYFNNPVVFWNKAIEDSPHSSTARRIGARVEARAGNQPKTFQLLKEAFALDSTEEYVNVSLAGFYYDAGDLDQAEYHLRQELARYRQPTAALMMSELMYKKGQKDSVIVYLEKVVDFKSTEQRPYNNLVALYLEKGDTLRARSTIRRATENGVALSGNVNF